MRKALDSTAPPTTSPSMVHIAAAAIRRDDKDSSLSRRAAQFGIFQRIAKPAYRLNEACVEFLAQAADKDLDRVGVAVEILVVEMFHQFGARHHLAAMMGERGQQPVFLAGELHRIAVIGDAAGTGVDAQLADLDIGGGGARRPAGGGPPFPPSPETPPRSRKHTPSIPTPHQ